MLERFAPSSIHFTQNSISESFEQSGPLSASLTLENLFKQMLHGMVKVDSLTPLTGMRYNEKVWVVAGNRRLYVYQKLEEYGALDRVPVEMEEFNLRKFTSILTTKSYGKDVVVRQDARAPLGNKLTDRIKKIYEKWNSLPRPSSSSIQRFDPNSVHPVSRSRVPTSRASRSGVPTSRMTSRSQNLHDVKRAKSDGVGINSRRSEDVNINKRMIMRSTRGCQSRDSFVTSPVANISAPVDLNVASEPAAADAEPLSQRRNIESDVISTDSIVSYCSSLGSLSSSFSSSEEFGTCIQASSSNSSPYSTRSIYGRLLQAPIWDAMQEKNRRLLRKQCSKEAGYSSGSDTGDDCDEDEARFGKAPFIDSSYFLPQTPHPFHPSSDPSDEGDFNRAQYSYNTSSSWALSDSLDSPSRCVVS